MPRSIVGVKVAALEPGEDSELVWWGGSFKQEILMRSSFLFPLRISQHNHHLGSAIRVSRVLRQVNAFAVETF